MYLPSTRAQLLAQLAEPWDLVIVGGGISGAGVLLEASRRGLKALLIEQRDFAWGTSSRSSKLVHGGLRYLKEGQLRLTLHSVRERQALMQQAPELIAPQSFLFGDYHGRKPGRRLFEIGLQIYDRMGEINSHRYYRNMDVDYLAPRLLQSGRRGGMVYQDAKTDDARLVLRVLQEAIAAGGTALNYVAARQLVLEQGQVNGVVARCALSGQSFSLRAQAVISATGVWADQLRAAVGGKPMLRPLRGSHLLLPAWRLPVAQSISFMHPHDGRPVFLYPWEGLTLVGTTDVDHRETLDDDASITAGEVAYLLAAINDQFPTLAIGYDDVVSSYAGVRPVVDDGSGDPSKAGRDHVVLAENGLVTLTGGKLTTFRLMALDALKAAAGRLRQPLDLSLQPIFRPAAALPEQLPPQVRQRLRGRYGPLATTVLAAAQEGDLETVPGTETLWLELRWAARCEGVAHLEDLLLRRTRLGNLLPHGGAGHWERIQQIAQAELGWDRARWQNEEDAYLALIGRCYSLPPEETVPDWRAYLHP